MSRSFPRLAVLALAAGALSIAAPRAAAAQQTGEHAGHAGTVAPQQDTAKKDARPPRAPRRDRNRIVREEFEERSFANLHDLVQTLRPTWLRVQRGASSANQATNSIVVYQENMRMGSVGALSDIDPTNVEALTYLSATEATSRFGSDHGAGAIIIQLRKS